MRLSLLLMICSSAACTTLERPDADLCVINAPNDQAECFNLRRDYSTEGHRNSDAAVSTINLIDLNDLNKYVCVNPEGFAELKQYVAQVRERLKQCGADQ